MRNTFIIQQKKRSESRKAVKIITKDFGILNNTRPSSSGFQAQNFTTWLTRGATVQTTPKLYSPFTRESGQNKPSIIEMLLAKHKNSQTKIKLSESKKTVTTRPATVISPTFQKDLFSKTPDHLRLASEKHIRESLSITTGLNKNSSFEQLDNFIIGSEIGKGAYASVRCAQNKQNMSKVAIKIYDKSKLLTPSRKKNAEREIKILTRLNHPNIIKLYQTIENRKSLNLIMEYVSGCSLMAYMKKTKDKRLEENDAKRVFKQIIEALEYCHSLGISHRDIKLENILINPQNNVKLIDFGFSTCFPNEKKLKLFCGTPSYMAPEIVNKQECHGPPSDIWAAGILLYVLLSGGFPFKAAHSKELYGKIQKACFSIPAHISPEASTLIRAMLNLDPLKRPYAKTVLEYSWFKEKNLIKNNSLGERYREVPQVRVSLNNTFDHGKKLE